MKIAHVQPYDHAVSGGVRAHVIHLARTHRDMGHDVTILTASSQAVPEQSADHRSDPQITLVAHGGIAALPSARSIARVPLSPVVWWRVRRLLHQGGYDVVHIHEPLVPLLALAATWHAVRHHGTVTVGTIHGFRPRFLPYQLLRRPLDRLMKQLSARVAVSPDARTWVQRYFPGAYHIIPDGVDVTKFADPQLLPVERYDDGHPNVLFVGRMEARKGFPVLLEAWCTVQQHVPKARLLVVGRFDARQQRYWQRQAQRRGLDNVEFVGYVPDEQLPQYYRTAQVFCAPSTGYEALGIVLLEAMAAGAAVVTTNIEGYRSVVRPDLEAAVVPPGDAAALAEQLVAVLTDLDLRQRLIVAARLRVEQYAWPRLAARLLQLYQSAKAHER